MVLHPDVAASIVPLRLLAVIRVTAVGPGKRVALSELEIR